MEAAAESREQAVVGDRTDPRPAAGFSAGSLGVLALWSLWFSSCSYFGGGGFITYIDLSYTHRRGFGFCLWWLYMALNPDLIAKYLQQQTGLLILEPAPAPGPGAVVHMVVHVSVACRAFFLSHIYRRQAPRTSYLRLIQIT